MNIAMYGQTVAIFGKTVLGLGKYNTYARGVPENDVPDERVPHEDHGENHEEMGQVRGCEGEGVRYHAEPRLEIHQL